MRPGGPDGLDPPDASWYLRQPCPEFAVAGLLFLVLALTAGRYGYHRDELYFIVAGRHPAFGYPDQPPLVPLLAAGWDAATGGHLWAFRLLPALAAALVVVIAATTCARLGGTRAAQLGTALVTALCTFTVAMGHLFSTSTFTLLLTALTVLLLVRALDQGSIRAWLLTGLIGGVALQVQILPALTLISCLAGLLLAGPRHPLRTAGPYLAAAVAAVLAAPYLIWQAAHGWPQLDVARDIAAGGSTSSVDRWQVIPFQLVIVGPLISPLLIVGIVALLRAPRFRPVRWLGVAYPVLLVLVTFTGGKPYYATGLVPAVLAVGVITTLEWIGTRAARRRFAGFVLVAHAIPTLLLCLPLAPVNSAVYAVADAVNPDTGETVGWERFAAEVAEVAQELPPAGTAVLTQNYGEAGALEAARRDSTPMPPVYSGHNGYALWGPPPDSVFRVVVVGYYPDEMGSWFRSCGTVTAIDTGTDNQEYGVPVQVCTGPRRPWAALWPHVVRIG